MDSLRRLSADRWRRCLQAVRRRCLFRQQMMRFQVIIISVIIFILMVMSIRQKSIPMLLSVTIRSTIKLKMMKAVCRLDGWHAAFALNKEIRLVHFFVLYYN